MYPAFRRKSRLPGTVWRGTYLLRPTVHMIIGCPRIAGDSHGWSTSRLCVGHISRMRTFDENSCAISITSSRSYFVPAPSLHPTSLAGTPGEVPASVHTMWLPGKVPLGGTFPVKRDLVWTGWKCVVCPAEGREWARVVPRVWNAKCCKIQETPDQGFLDARAIVLFCASR